MVGVREGPAVPASYSLNQNYPNPFNPSTTIGFSLRFSGFTLLKVFDMLGRQVATLVNEEMNAGDHQVRWEASGMASGVYVYRLESGGFSSAKKLLLLR
jgi:hypothetical protein